uniref:Uncharacterized protein n=1 Tax=Cacopsylla melanoneura TaxID=428564 RepID=A0A8D8TGD8_9HEMI
MHSLQIIKITNKATRGESRTFGRNLASIQQCNKNDVTLAQSMDNASPVVCSQQTCPVRYTQPVLFGSPVSKPVILIILYVESSSHVDELRINSAAVLRPAKLERAT